MKRSLAALVALAGAGVVFTVFAVGGESWRRGSEGAGDAGSEAASSVARTVPPTPEAAEPAPMTDEEEQEALRKWNPKNDPPNKPFFVSPDGKKYFSVDVKRVVGGRIYRQKALAILAPDEEWDGVHREIPGPHPVSAVIPAGSTEAYQKFRASIDANASQPAPEGQAAPK